MENYFNYFTEIEEHFQRRWGGILRLSPMDWVLIETWKDAGIPLEAVLRGIDVTFEHYESRPSKTRKVNGLGFCTQEVLAAAGDMKEAAVGANTEPPKDRRNQGFEPEVIAAFLQKNAAAIVSAKVPQGAVSIFLRETAQTLRELTEDAGKKTARLEDLERRLTVLEEKLFAMLLTSTPDDEIVAMRADADRELAPYRRKMSAPQIDQLQKQYLQKRLLEKYKLPRLSLFYM